MRSFPLFLVLAVLALLSGLSPAPSAAQDAGAPQAASQPPAAETASGFEVLRGRWIRPDGGYVVTIRDVDADGNIDGIYSNPRFLPFSKATATREGKILHVFLELQAGGYNGSTYTLTYDPEKDVLQGVYFQAVAQRKYDIFFIREKQ